MRNSRPKLLLALATVATPVAAALMMSSPPDPPVATECSFPDELRTWSPLYRRAMLTSDTLVSYLEFEGGARALIVGRHERSGVDSPDWDSTEQMLRADMDIIDVAFVDGGATLYVAGIDDTAAGCQFVIERWDLSYPAGSVVASRAAGPTRGVSTSGPAPLVTSVVGGPYVAPSRRSTPTPARTVTEVYRALDGSIWSAIEADPQKRFLLGRIFGAGHIVSLDLLSPPPVTPVVEFDAAVVPELADLNGDLTARLHSTSGSVFRIDNNPKHTSYFPTSTINTYLIDTDHDGVFEAIFPMEEQAFLASPFADNTSFLSLVAE